MLKIFLCLHILIMFMFAGILLYATMSVYKFFKWLLMNENPCNFCDYNQELQELREDDEIIKEMMFEINKN